MKPTAVALLVLLFANVFVWTIVLAEMLRNG